MEEEGDVEDVLFSEGDEEEEFFRENWKRQLFLDISMGWSVASNICVWVSFCVGLSRGDCAGVGKGVVATRGDRIVGVEDVTVTEGANLVRMGTEDGLETGVVEEGVEEDLS